MKAVAGKESRSSLDDLMARLLTLDLLLCFGHVVYQPFGMRSEK